MKKVFIIALCVVICLVASACGVEPTVEPEKTVSISDLGEYTIVYPQNYHEFKIVKKNGEEIYEYRMQDIQDLKTAIKALTGKEPEAISDKNYVEDGRKKIILACSSANVCLKEKTTSLPNGLDYVIALDGDNIVLGGDNYYADMRAVYALINDYIGYDDISGELNGKTKNIGEMYEFNYTEPIMKIFASNIGGSFPSYTAAKTVKDCNFNYIFLNILNIDKKIMLDQARWFSRLGIKMILVDYRDFLIPLLGDCPAVYGHFIIDEPKIDDIEFLEKKNNDIKKYVENYSELGLIPYINYAGLEENMTFFLENSQYFEDCPMVSIDIYWGNGGASFTNWYNGYGTKVLHQWETANELCQKSGRELWSWIQSFGFNQRYDFGKKMNSSKMMRWQSNIVLSFGTKAIQYFHYSYFEPLKDFNFLLDEEYNVTEEWYVAQRTNAELLKLAEMLMQYDYKGTYTYDYYGTEEDGYWAELTNQYHGMDNILTTKGTLFEKSPVLVGCFEKAEGNGSAFLITNISELDQLDYDKSNIDMVILAINGTPTFYVDGEKLSESDYTYNDGVYVVPLQNGHSVFVTVD